MSREKFAYRENLQDILEFFDGRRLLSIEDVKAYTGITDRRTVTKKFPFQGHNISAVTLAMALSGGQTHE